ncbi:MAG: ABC transporter permease subunit [Actinomycetota bacterium]
MPKLLIFLILGLPLVGAYAMYACGIVVVYQASRVVNLAHGAMAVVPAYLFTWLVRSHVPMVIALVLSLAAGAVVGIVIERIFVRRLRSGGATAQTVGTVAAFGLLVSVTAKIAGTGSLNAASVFPQGQIHVGSSVLQYGHIGLLLVAIASIGALSIVFRTTWLGLALRGAAENRRAATLVGVDPNRTSMIAWAIGGVLAACAGVMLAAVTAVSPYSLSASVLPAYVAALIGGLDSLPGALVGSSIVGLVIGLQPLLQQVSWMQGALGHGGKELMLAILAMIVMAVRGKRFGMSEPRMSSIAPRALRSASLSKPVTAVLAIIAVGWVFIPHIGSAVLGDANLALLFAIAALSVVLLTGWIGQISLGQAAFVGVGAFVSIKAASVLHVPFPFTILVAALVASASAAILGAVALRVRGLYLAVATLIFAWMADSSLFASPWLVGAGGSATLPSNAIGYRHGFPYFDFSNQRIVYLVALAGASMVIVVMANIKRSKTGRAFLAVRGSETAAASLGISVIRYKLVGFALAGFIAGLAGGLTAVAQGTIVPAEFALTWSLFFLAVAVVGGLSSVGGAVASGALFSALNLLFLHVSWLDGYLDVVSAALLTIVLIAYPGGLSRIPDALAPWLERAGLGGTSRRTTAPRSSVLSILARRFVAELRGLRHEIAASTNSVLATAEAHSPAGLAPTVRAFHAELRGVGSELRSVRRAFTGAARKAIDRAVGEIEDRPPESKALNDIALEANDVTVSYGGLIAVDGVSLRVGSGQIVGLIGPNGAGKTTMFNAIAGFVEPAHGTIFINAVNATSKAVHERAELGLGRTFQSIQLSMELTVKENLLAATHVANRSGFFSNIVVARSTSDAETQVHARVAEVGAMIGIDELLDRVTGDLSFGTLRMVELARAVVTEAPVLLLDEPASGLDSNETAQLARIIRKLRDEQGLSFLLIEHDISFVLSLCDRVYVLDQGKLIAHGSADVVARDHAVVAAYLGSSV